MGWGQCKLFCQAGSNPSPVPSECRARECEQRGDGLGPEWGLCASKTRFTQIQTFYYDCNMRPTCRPLYHLVEADCDTRNFTVDKKKLVILQLFPALAPTWAWQWCRVECGGAGSRSSEAGLPGSAQQTSLSCTQQSATLQSPDMGNVSSCQCCQCCQEESGARSWPGAGQERSRRPLWPRWCACSGGGGHMSPGAPLPLSPVRGCGQKPCQQSMSDWTTKYSPPWARVNSGNSFYLSIITSILLNWVYTSRGLFKVRVFS